MDKKIKIIISVLVVSNVLLISIVAWGFNQMKYVTERVLVVDVADNLFALNNKITHQSDNEWADPSLVTDEVVNTLEGISLSMNVADTSNTLSEKDLEILWQLWGVLSGYRPYPMDTFDSYSNISEQNMNDFEQLGQVLSEVGIDIKNANEFGWETESLIETFEELTVQLQNK